MQLAQRTEVSDAIVLPARHPRQMGGKIVSQGADKNLVPPFCHVPAGPNQLARSS